MSWMCPLAEDRGQLVCGFHWTSPQVHFLFADFALCLISGMSPSHVYKFWVLWVLLVNHQA